MANLFLSIYKVRYNVCFGVPGDWQCASHGNKMFSLRIVNTDHYLAVPIPGLDPCRSDFRGTDVSHVPVIRVYGPTSAGL